MLGRHLLVITYLLRPTLGTAEQCLTRNCDLRALPRTVLKPAIERAPRYPHRLRADASEPDGAHTFVIETVGQSPALGLSVVALNADASRVHFPAEMASRY